MKTGDEPQQAPESRSRAAPPCCWSTTIRSSPTRSPSPSASDYEVHACGSRAAAIELLRQLDAPPPLALIDLGLPPTPHSPDEGFQPDRRSARAFARDQDLRALGPERRRQRAPRARARRLGVRRQARASPALLKRLLARALEAAGRRGAELVGESPPLDKLRSQIAQFAPSPFPVLIEGESGSGKELVAHAACTGCRPRAAGPTSR